jgi:glycosyltransferase involved in cell wall biosynthesis
MGVVIVFEPACDAHLMKDVVQFPNAIAQMVSGKNATLITRPNQKQNELENHIKVLKLDLPLKDNYRNFESYNFSNILTSDNWYLNACRKAASIGNILVLYPWYGDPYRGARIFKIRRWLRFKKAFVILKTDGYLNTRVNTNPDFKEIVNNSFRYFFFNKIIFENPDFYNKLIEEQSYFSRKLVLIPNCPIDIYNSVVITPYEKRPLNFLFVGRISDKEKGADILIENWLKIHSKLKGWVLQLVGPCDEDFKEEFKLKILQANAEESVQWCPSATPKELLNYYDNSRIVVCSSRKESGPIILSEAAKCGCAFIGTTVGEIPSLLKGLSGLVYEVDKLCDEMLLFALNENIAKEQALKLQKKVVDRNWSEQVKKLK